MGLKQIFSTAILAVLALVVIVVLGPPPVEKPHLQGRKIVKFWHMWAAEWGPVIEKICKRFNESQTEYEVVPLYVPADGAATKFLLSAAGGDTPDVVSQWNPVMGTWADKGLVRPVEEMMTPEEKERFLREAYPIFRRYAVYRGKIMSMIPGIDCNAVYYRLDHLREVGRDQNSLPQTLEELVELAKQLDKRAANGDLKRVGLLTQNLTGWAPIFGGRFSTEGDFKIDTPENERALEFLVSEVKRYGKDNLQRFISAQPKDTGLTAPLLTGNYSILLDGQWKVKQTNDVAPNGFEYCVAPLPPPKGGVPMASETGANYLMIPTAAKCPEGAWAFMKFWIGFDDAELCAPNVTEMGWLPFCDRVANSKAYRDYLAKYPQFDSFVRLVKSPNLVTGPVGPLQSYVSDQITKADQAATHLSVSPHEALANLQQMVIHEIERQRRLGNVH